MDCDLLERAIKVLEKSGATEEQIAKARIDFREKSLAWTKKRAKEWAESLYVFHSEAKFQADGFELLIHLSCHPDTGKISDYEIGTVATIEVCHDFKYGDGEPRVRFTVKDRPDTTSLSPRRIDNGHLEDQLEEVLARGEAFFELFDNLPCADVFAKLSSLPVIGKDKLIKRSSRGDDSHYGSRAMRCVEMTQLVYEKYKK